MIANPKSSYKLNSSFKLKFFEKLTIISNSSSLIEFPSNDYIIQTYDVKPNKIKIVIYHDIPDIVIFAEE